MDTLKLRVRLRIACHQRGGKKSKSPGSRTAVIACGSTSSMNRLGGCREVSNTSTWDVFVISLAAPSSSSESSESRSLAASSTSFSEDASSPNGCIAPFSLLPGGASQTCFLPTTCTVSQQVLAKESIATRSKRPTIAIVVRIRMRRAISGRRADPNVHQHVLFSRF